MGHHLGQRARRDIVKIQRGTLQSNGRLSALVHAAHSSFAMSCADEYSDVYVYFDSNHNDADSVHYVHIYIYICVESLYDGTVVDESRYDDGSSICQ